MATSIRMNPETKVYQYRVSPGDRGTRLDRYLAERLEFEGVSRTRIQGLVQEGEVSVDGAPARAAFRLKGGERVEVRIPPPRSIALEPADLPLTILYQDGDIVVVDKPAGMAVHPAPGSEDGTLVHALLYHVHDLSGIGGEERPGIVHRLDKDTSGVLVVAKTDRAHVRLAAQFKAHSASRRYLALVRGQPPCLTGTWISSIGRNPRNRLKMASVRKGGRRAVTHYRVLETFPGTSLVQFALETGRTHQIRVHCADAGCPVLGDDVYGGHWRRSLPDDPAVRRAFESVRGQLLHAFELKLRHPATDQEMVFNSPLPPRFQHVLDLLRALPGHGAPEHSRGAT